MPVSDVDEPPTDGAPAWSLAPSKRTRISRVELRARVLDAAEQLTAENGLSVSPFHINVEHLIRHIGLPRSSVYAAFGGKEGLITDLIVQIVERDAEGPGFPPAVQQLVRETLERWSHLMSDQAGRDAVLWEAIRVGIERNYRELVVSPAWRTSTAITLSWPMIPDAAQDRIRAALARSSAGLERSIADYYLSLLAVFARRMRPGMTVEMVARANIAAVEGAAQRALASGDAEGSRVELPGPDGTPVSWHQSAWICRAIVDNATEPEAEPESAACSVDTP